LEWLVKYMYIYIYIWVDIYDVFCWYVDGLPSS